MDGSHHIYGGSHPPGWLRDDPELDPAPESSGGGSTPKSEPTEEAEHGPPREAAPRGRALGPPTSDVQQRLAERRRSKRDYSPDLVTPLDDLHAQEIDSFFAGDPAADSLDVILMRAEVRTESHLNVGREQEEPLVKEEQEEEAEVVKDEEVSVEMEAGTADEGSTSGGGRLLSDEELAEALQAAEEAQAAERGLALQFAGRLLKQNRAVVLAAVRDFRMQETPLALEFAAEELKGDWEVVLAAVRRNGMCLEFASSELRKSRRFILEAIQATQAWWLLKLASEELQADLGFVEECKEVAGTGIIFTFYDNYDCSVMMRKRFKTAGASVPGGSAYEFVMARLNETEHGSTATVWFGDELVFGNTADDSSWTHPCSDCGRDSVPVPVKDRDQKWRALVESRSARLVLPVDQRGAKAPSGRCRNLLRSLEHLRGSGSAVNSADWSDKYGAGSSELSDADADALKEAFRNGRPDCWGEGMIRISHGCAFRRKAPVHPDTQKPLGVGCRWERQVLDNLEIPVYAFFMP
ncbi:pum [Symbiodinium natans]|uniref:Pum protein n=1 Tax=Symbiodinium natans TaxID=878477 RepID=A0A812SEP6_9DINO|nr:pum [Symbiodinium natans]